MSIISGGGAVVGAGGAAAAYEIERSLRFNSADSAYLNRTPASNGDRQKFTFSFWIKRSSIPAAIVTVLCVDDAGGGAYPCFVFNSNTAYLQLDSTAAGSFYWETTQLFRDVSAWYHIVWAVDTTQASNTNRMKLWVNGTQVTAFSTQQTITQSVTTSINSTALHEIGRFVDLNNRYLDGYLTEIHMVDGQQLDATDFGEFNSDTGVWQPKAYTGTYGTNGFYLNFSDNSGTTSTTLGADSSGNGNNWTPNNFSVTAGAGNDSLVDSPTRYGTDTGAGGEVRGNYCTLNPLTLGTNTTINNGNLTLATTYSVDIAGVASTIGVNSGKWYWEVTVSSHSTYPYIGISSPSRLNYLYGGAMYAIAARGGGSIEISGSDLGTITTSATGVSWTSGDVVMIALDCDARKLWFGKNGTWFNSGSPTGGTNQQASWTVSSLVFPMIMGYNGQGNGSSFNFGQRAFAHTAPSGFKALVTTNLPEPTVADGGEYFNTVLYTGNASTNAITGVGFQPDWVWIKSRSNTYFHRVFDAVRGATKALYTNDTLAEETKTGELTSFDSDGFSLGGDTGANGSGATFVAWNWKANGAGVSNTDGTITSTVSVNTTSGFSIVNWTSTGSNATVGHGLGVAPAMVIVKGRSATSQWFTWHTSLTSGAYALILNLTDAQDSYPTVFNSTTPTSSVFSVGTSLTNGTTAVAYCFAPVAGYSAFGSYTGNGSADGTFVFTGFRPRWVMLKRTDAGDGWLIRDSIRNPYNVTNLALLANESTAEYVDTTLIDFTSNGFKFRHQNSLQNASGGTYIYMAFAENPFAYSLAR
jgi:hypothetical protein